MFGWIALMLNPLEIAKQSVAEKNPPRPNSANIVDLMVKNRAEPDRAALYLRPMTRDRLARLAYIMAVPFTEAIARLATLEYEAVPLSEWLGKTPAENLGPRALRIKASMTPDTRTRYEALAQELGIHSRFLAMEALDTVLRGKALPVGFATLEDASNQLLRRNPLERVDSGSDLYGRMTLRISTIASRGLGTIVAAFDRRRKTSRLLPNILALADLPGHYELVSDILDLQRFQRPLVLPLRVVEHFSKVGLEMMLVEKPALRRPSTLVSAALEFIGQGAIQIVHNKRSVTSRDALRTEAEQRRERIRRVAP